jgi:cytochrome c oxidase subunit 4
MSRRPPYPFPVKGGGDIFGGEGIFEGSRVKTIRYRTYILVWLGLIVLTGMTVSLAGMNLRSLSIFLPLLIAAAKSGLVLGYFMHLRYETGLLFKLMIPIVLATLTIFIGLTFTDVAFR